MSIAGPLIEAQLSEVEQDRELVLKMCRRIIKGRKSKAAERLKAGDMISSIQGIYQPVSALHTKRNGKNIIHPVAEIRSIGTLIGSKQVAKPEDELAQG